MTRLHLRSKREVKVRSAFAWLSNIVTYSVFAMLCRIYGGMFGEEGAKDCITGWATSIGIAIAIIEPINILALAILPLFGEDSFIGRLYNNAFAIYDTFC